MRTLPRVAWPPPPPLASPVLRPRPHPPTGAVGGGSAGANTPASARDIHPPQETQALLASPATVLDPAAGHLRELAAGAQVIAPAGAVVQLPIGSLVPIAASLPSNVEAL